MHFEIKTGDPVYQVLNIGVRKICTAELCENAEMPVGKRTIAQNPDNQSEEEPR